MADDAPEITMRVTGCDRLMAVASKQRRLRGSKRVRTKLKFRPLGDGIAR
jgi:hypothetical protein